MMEVNSITLRNDNVKTSPHFLHLPCQGDDDHVGKGIFLKRCSKTVAETKVGRGQRENVFILKALRSPGCTSRDIQGLA